MEEVTKTTSSKTNHRKTVSSSSSGDEATEPLPINEKVWLYEENIKKVDIDMRSKTFELA